MKHSLAGGAGSDGRPFKQPRRAGAARQATVTPAFVQPRRAGAGRQATATPAPVASPTAATAQPSTPCMFDEFAADDALFAALDLDRACAPLPATASAPAAAPPTAPEDAEFLEGALLDIDEEAVFSYAFEQMRDALATIHHDYAFGVGGLRFADVCRLNHGNVQSRRWQRYRRPFVHHPTLLRKLTPPFLRHTAAAAGVEPPTRAMFERLAGGAGNHVNLSTFLDVMRDHVQHDMRVVHRVLACRSATAAAAPAQPPAAAMPAAPLPHPPEQCTTELSSVAGAAAPWPLPRTITWELDNWRRQRW